ncbi:hypothetical protein ACLKA6_015933 [Drosophila palustris]
MGCESCPRFASPASGAPKRDTPLHSNQRSVVLKLKLKLTLRRIGGAVVQQGVKPVNQPDLRPPSPRSPPVVSTSQVFSLAKKTPRLEQQPSRLSNK